MLRKHKVQLFSVIYLMLAFILPVGLCIFYPQPLFFVIFVLTNLFIVGCFALLMFPIGTWCIGGRKAVSRLPFWGWCGLILLVEMGMVALFFAQDSLVINNIHVYIADHSVVSMQQAIAFLWGNWGLFPWALLAFVAVRFAYFSQAGRPYAPFSVPWFRRAKSFLPTIMRRVIDIYIQIATRAFIVFNVVFLALQCVYFLCRCETFFHPLNGIIIGSMLLILYQKNWFLRVQLIQFPEKYCHQGVQLLRMFLTVVLVGLALLFIDHFMFKASPYLLDKDINVTLLGITNPILLLSLWHWSWWILGAPFLASLLIKLSYGRDVRSFVTVVLLFPIFFMIMHAILTHAHIDWMPLALHMRLIIFALGLCFLFGVLLYPKAYEYLWFGFIPLKAPKKIRKTELQRIWYLTATIIGVLYVVGFAAVELMAMMVVLPLIGIFCLSVCGPYRVEKGGRYGNVC